MRRDDVIAKLKRAEPQLRAFGVAALYLFGSHARDEARADSDVDLFVDPISDPEFGFIKYVEAYETLRRTLGEDVELGYSTRAGLSPYVRSAVENEAIRVF
jgi:uncharacterized protein